MSSRIPAQVQIVWKLFRRLETGDALHVVAETGQ